MEERTVKITLEEAKEWYKGDNESLKQIALQAFTEKELTTEPWENIKTFEDACAALGLPSFNIENTMGYTLNIPETGIDKMLEAQRKLSIIKTALNGNWSPQLNEGEVYYSWLRWYSEGANIPDGWTKQATFRNTTTGKKYTLVGGGDYDYYVGGLGNSYYGCGVSRADLGFLGCKSMEIALHLTKYFGQVIFDAIYGQYNNYNWV